MPDVVVNAIRGKIEELGHLGAGLSRSLAETPQDREPLGMGQNPQRPRIADHDVVANGGGVCDSRVCGGGIPLTGAMGGIGGMRASTLAVSGSFGSAAALRPRAPLGPPGGCLASGFLIASRHRVALLSLIPVPRPPA